MPRIASLLERDSLVQLLSVKFASHFSRFRPLRQQIRSPGLPARPSLPRRQLWPSFHSAGFSKILDYALSQRGAARSAINSLEASKSHLAKYAERYGYPLELHRTLRVRHPHTLEREISLALLAGFHRTRPNA